MTDLELRRRLELARKIAWSAGAVTLEHYQASDLHVERKSDDSPVTAADRAAETLLREQIAVAFPDDAIVGEEFGAQSGTTAFRWVLDPIDGTKTFVAGVPLYGTLIGVERERQGVAGVIHMPALQEMVFAARGHGAWHQRGRDSEPQPARVSPTELGQSVLLTTDVAAYSRRGAAAAIEQLQAATRMTRTWGDCYGYLLVATGRAQLMLDPQLHVWDAAALQPVLEEAGGRFVDWRGEPTIHGGDGIGAASPELAAAAVAATSAFPPAALD